MVDAARDARREGHERAYREALRRSAEEAALAYRARAGAIVEGAGDKGVARLALALDLAEGALPVAECVRLLLAASPGSRA